MDFIEFLWDFIGIWKTKFQNPKIQPETTSGRPTSRSDQISST